MKKSDGCGNELPSLMNFLIDNYRNVIHYRGKGKLRGMVYFVGGVLDKMERNAAPGIGISQVGLGEK